MKNGLIIFICAFVFGSITTISYSAFAQLINEIKPEEETQIGIITITKDTIAEEKFQQKEFFSEKYTQYTTQELQLLELRKINSRLQNIENYIWKIKNSK